MADAPALDYAVEVLYHDDHEAVQVARLATTAGTAWSAVAAFANAAARSSRKLWRRGPVLAASPRRIARVLARVNRPGWP